MTNFHVAFGSSKNPSTGEVNLVDTIEPGHTVYFSFDLDSKTGKFRKVVTARVVDFGNYEYGTDRGFLGDLALLRLDQCVGKQYGHLEITSPDANKLVPVGRLMTVSSSRTSSGGNDVLVEDGCKSEPITIMIGIILTNCVSTPGMSGSMILEEGADKKWRLAGMTTMHNTFSDGSQVSKSLYVSAITKFLDSVSAFGSNQMRR